MIVTIQFLSNDARKTCCIIPAPPLNKFLYGFHIYYISNICSRQEQLFQLILSIFDATLVPRKHFGHNKRIAAKTLQSLIWQRERQYYQYQILYYAKSDASSFLLLLSQLFFHIFFIHLYLSMTAYKGFHFIIWLNYIIFTSKETFSIPSFFNILESSS